jgi:hypothetical protein
MNTQVGFIILRHVVSVETDMYWQTCYDCIREFYPENQIMIIDDGSMAAFLSTNKRCYKTMVINSEFPKRGELLPYHYFLQTEGRLFTTAVMLHDSMFINRYIDFDGVQKYRKLWNFADHQWDDAVLERDMIRSFDVDGALLPFHDTLKWSGCFGAMTVVRYDYLKAVVGRYDFVSALMPIVQDRSHRCALERVLACVLEIHDTVAEPALLGDIHTYCPWGLTYAFYLNNRNKLALPIVKVWTGR